jgi:hypothetical protein
MRNDPVPARRHAPSGSALLRITRPLVDRSTRQRPIGDRCRRFEAQTSLRCLQLCLRVQVVQVQRQSHSSIERDSGSTYSGCHGHPQPCVARTTSASIQPNRVGTPRAGAAPRLRLAPGHDKRSLARSGASHSPLINGFRLMTVFFAWPPIGR